jgi:hypothetical protein
MSMEKKGTKEKEPVKTIYTFINPETGERAEQIWEEQLRNLPTESKKRFKKKMDHFNEQLKNRKLK